MSLATFKKKAKNSLSSLTKRSGKPPGGYFLPQGPFGGDSASLKIALEHPSAVGFSINGGTRNIGYIGKELKFSKQGTPFRGIHPYGSGTSAHTKTGKAYYDRTQPVYNVNEVIVLGQQSPFIKPSVLSTYGMLQKKYRWIYNGQYPNYWVQPNYGHTTQSYTKSQGNYIHNLAVSNICVVDVNNQEKYVNNYKNCGATTCHTTPALFKFNDMARNAPYTKFIKQPLDSSVQTMRIQRKCTDPKGIQKPFPFATNGQSCNNLNINYVRPPAWYIKENPKSVPDKSL
jgi:hypothetical protein